MRQYKMKFNYLLTLLLLPAIAEARSKEFFPQQSKQEAALVQQEQPPVKRSFDDAAASIGDQLEASMAELSALRETLAKEKVPLNSRLRELESELSDVRAEFKKTTRLLDSRTLDLSNLNEEIKKRADEATYVSNLLGEYVRNFESRLHIAEVQRYSQSLEAAKLAPENSGLGESEVFQVQLQVIHASLDRMLENLSGTQFEGSAVDAEGIVRKGTIALVGPSAIFRSADGKSVGTAEQRIGSIEPTIIPFTDPEDQIAADLFVSTARGSFPFDPTLGKAHKIAATQESLIEHIKQGGAVMVPIFALAAIALLIALFKWVGMLLVRKPSKKGLQAVLSAVESGDDAQVREQAALIKGPTGTMLRAAAEHIREPRELIEEVMYEQVLRTKLKLQRFLPFIAISAASAPLLGLLGTVTGIINTFKLITVFGSGDVKTLSGGISEALITTKFGLIVAIPSLLLHAFLSRKARSAVGQMESAAIGFVNQVSKNSPANNIRIKPANTNYDTTGFDPSLVRAQVNEIIGELLGPLREDGEHPEGAPVAPSK